MGTDIPSHGIGEPNPDQDIPDEVEATEDQVRRVAAQALLALLPLELQDISYVELTDLPSGDSALRVVIVKQIPAGRAVAVGAGWNLIANEARVKTWPKSIRDEYRRQYNPTPTGSFAPRPTIHPDQVDLWAGDQP